MGPATALRLIKEHGSIEKVIPALTHKQREGVPQDWKYDEARDLFRHPDIADAEAIEVGLRGGERELASVVMGRQCRILAKQWEDV